MNNKGRLTGRYKEVFDFLVAHKKANDGNSPTFREIIWNTSLTTTSIVKWYLDNLEKLKLIEIGEGSRNIQVVGGSWTYQESENER